MWTVQFDELLNPHLIRQHWLIKMVLQTAWKSHTLISLNMLNCPIHYFSYTHRLKSKFTISFIQTEQPLIIIFGHLLNLILMNPRGRHQPIFAPHLLNNITEPVPILSHPSFLQPKPSHINPNIKHPYNIMYKNKFTFFFP